MKVDSALHDKRPASLRSGCWSAFTLTELLVVMGIVAVLAVLIFPAVRRGMDSARQATCMGNLKNIAVATAAFSGENDGLLPATYNFRNADGDRIISWKDSMEPYLPMDLNGTKRFNSSPYRCPGNPIGGMNYVLINGVSRFSTYQWEARHRVARLENIHKIPYLMDGPPLSSQILGRPTRKTDSSMVYVQLSVNSPGGTAIRTRTGPDNPLNPSGGNYWIPPHSGGDSLNILYADGSIRSVSVPHFISPEFTDEIVIPPGNPDPRNLR